MERKFGWGIQPPTQLERSARKMGGFEYALSLAGDALHMLRSEPARGIAVWFLAIVFLWSGVVKLRRPALAAMAMVDFGVVRRPRSGFGSALGTVEALLAVMLVSGAVPSLVLPVAAALLWFFAFLIARSLRSGESFECHCFGDSGSKLSRWTLARTVALAFAASAQISAPTLAGYSILSQSYVLQAVSAMALAGTLVLLGRVPRLLSWNRDPFVVGTVGGSER